MMYVNGLGYVEDPTTFAVPSSRVKAYHSKSEGTGFDEILKNYTAENNGKTYTLKEIFEEAAELFGLPESLLESVAYRESGFDVNSTSSSGAMGLMQLMPGTAAELGVTNAYDAYQNIMGGAKYLKQLYDRFGGDLSLTLAAYNAGPGAVSRAGGIPSDSVRSYVSSILNMMQNATVTVPNMTVTVNSPSSTADSVNSTGSSTGSTNATGTTAANTAINTTTNTDINIDYREILQTQLTNQYYNNMLNIISGMGDDSDSDDDDNSSLTDLYRLGVQQQLGITNLNSSNSSTEAILKAIQAYAAGTSLLDT